MRDLERQWQLECGEIPSEGNGEMERDDNQQSMDLMDNSTMVHDVVHLVTAPPRLAAKLLPDPTGLNNHSPILGTGSAVPTNSCV